MATYQMQAPDGHTYTIDGPDGATDDQVRAEIIRQNPHLGDAATAATPPAAPAKPKTPQQVVPQGTFASYAPKSSMFPQNQIPNAGDRVDVLRGLKGVALGVPESALSLISGGASALGGGLGYLGTLGLTGGDTGAASAVQQGIQNALTYTPRSEGGKLINNAIQTPFNVLGDVSENAGGALADRGLPLAGSILKTAIQGAPLIYGARGPISNVYNGMNEGLKTTEAAASTGPSVAASYAKTYADNNLGGWDSMSDGAKQLLTKLANDAGNLDGLDPVQLQRYVRLQSLNIPATRGNVTRNLSDITNEEALARAPAGQPLRNISANQDQRLYELLNEQRPSGVSTPQQVGSAVQGTIRSQQEAAQAGVDDLYNKARVANEYTLPVETADLEDWLKNPANSRNAPYIKSALADYGKDGRPITLSDLDEIRKEAVANQNAAGPKAYYAGQAIRVIDGIMDRSGGQAFQAARAAYRDMQSKYADPALIDKLVSNRGADRAVALEDTFDTVVRRGSNEQLQNLQSTLTQTPNGAQAVNALKSATIDFLKSKAQEAANEQGTAGFRGQSFLNAFRELDSDGKIDTLFGNDAQKLRNIAQAVEDIRTKPATRIAGSDTVPRLLSALQNFSDKVSKVPIVGTAAGKIVGTAEFINNIGKEGKDIRRATSDPFSDAIAAQENSAASAARMKMLGNYLRIASGTIGQQGMQQ